MSKIFKLENIKNCLLVETNIIIPTGVAVLETHLETVRTANLGD